MKENREEEEERGEKRGRKRGEERERETKIKTKDKKKKVIKKPGNFDSPTRDHSGIYAGENVFSDLNPVGVLLCICV
jgi:hypothetical protein